MLSNRPKIRSVLVSNVLILSRTTESLASAASGSKETAAKALFEVPPRFAISTEGEDNERLRR